MIKAFLLAALVLTASSCVSKAKPGKNATSGQVVKKSRDLVCSKLLPLVDRASECAKKNEQLFSGVDISPSDLMQLCSAARNYKKLGLGSVGGTSFREWYFSQLTSAFEYSHEQMKLAKKIIGQYSDGYGLGIGVKGAAVASTGGMAEIITHNQKMALFCAASLGVSSDAGVGADIIAIKTLGCSTNQDYTGQFASISFDGSFEFAALPLEVGGSFNLGLDLSILVEKFVPYWQKNRRSIQNDLVQLKTAKLGSDVERFARDVVLILFLAVEKAGSETTELSQLIETELLSSRDYLTRYKNVLKTANGRFNLTSQIGTLQKNLQDNYEFKYLTEAISQLLAPLTGCNSLTFYAGASASIMPMAITLSLSQYEILSEADLPTFAGMNAFFRDLYRYTQADSQDGCQFDEAQARAYVQILKLLKTLDQARAIAPGLTNIAKCHQKLFKSTVSLSDFIRNKLGR